MNQINQHHQQEQEQQLQHHDFEQLSVDELNNKSNIDLYGLLVKDSIKVESNILIACLDDILRIFNDYFKYLSRSEAEISTINTQITPVIEAKQSELLNIYRKIDDLELFINSLRKNYDELEKRVEQAEAKEYTGKFNKLKSYFNKIM